MLQIRKEDFSGVSEEGVKTANKQLKRLQKNSGIGSLKWLWEEIIYNSHGEEDLRRGLLEAMLKRQPTTYLNGRLEVPKCLQKTWFEEFICGYYDYIDQNFIFELMKAVKKAIKKAGYASPVALLNTSILTTFGAYSYTPLTVNAAKAIISRRETLSAIGHQSTAEIMTELFGQKIEQNRINFAQEVGQQAIIFKLKGRPEEGKILSKKEIEDIGYEVGMLIRTK